MSGASRLEALGLSPRQIECLQLVSEGATSGEIAEALSLSARTVEQYVARACERLDARSRAHAVARGLQLGLIHPRGAR